MVKFASVRKKILCGLLSFAAVISLAACGGSIGKKDNGTGTDAENLTEIDVVLDWYPNAIHTFLYDAVNKGYFAEEGLKVNLISPAESVDALTFVSTKKAEIGLTYPMEVIQGVADENMQVRAIGAVTQTSLSCLATLEGSGITADMSTLRGKKVGYSGNATSKAIVETVAGSAGLKDSDFQLINVGFDLTTALTSGNVDMTDGMMMNDEIITMQNNGYKVKTFQYTDYGVPQMYDIVMVANDEAYDENPEIYQGFLRACSRGFGDMKASEDDALKVIMNEMNSEDNPLDEKQQRQSYETLLPQMETDQAKFLTMTDQVWQNVIDWMKENDLIKRDVKPSDVMTAPQL